MQHGPRDVIDLAEIFFPLRLLGLSRASNGENSNSLPVSVD